MPAIRHAMRLCVVGTLVVLQLGFIVLLIIYDVTQVSLGVVMRRWAVVVPYALYSLGTVPYCCFWSTRFWSGLAHGLALGYAIGLPVIMWFIARPPLCHHDPRALAPAVDRAAAELFAEQVSFLSGLYIATTLIRTGYECYHREMEREDRDLALLKAELDELGETAEPLDPTPPPPGRRHATAAAHRQRQTSPPPAKPARRRRQQQWDEEDENDGEEEEEEEEEEEAADDDTATYDEEEVIDATTYNNVAITTTS